MSRKALFVACAWIAFAVSAPATDHFFDSNGVRIHFRMEGKGEPVVLIHGLMGTTWNWGPFFDTLAADYQAIALNCRGSGKSEKPHQPSQYGMEMVADVVRLLDHLKIKKAHVVGSSMGAAIATKLLEVRPDLLLTVTLLAGASVPNPDTEFINALAESIEQGKGLGPIMRKLTPAGRTAPSEEQIRRSVEMVAKADPTAVAAKVRGSKAWAVDYAKLSSGAVPVHAIIGELDPFKSEVDGLVPVIPHLKVTVIKGAGHGAFDRPEAQKSLMEFLAVQRAAAKTDAAPR
ncbi:MAG: alpha/beta fold hydrolase [Bryobacterales bacterium]|nr:alpha/beta fold hydrolase [Bryobacterales bacterium]